MPSPILPENPPQEMVSRRSRPWPLMVVAAIGLGALSLIMVVRHQSFDIVLDQPTEAQRSELVLLDGRLIRTGETNAFNGILIENYEDSSLKSRSAIVDGKLHGVSEGWHTNRQLAVRELFQEGISHGLRTKWYPTGSKMSEANIEEGQIHGAFQRWHENGLIAEQIEMENGKPNGISRAFFPSGYLKAEASMQAGQVLKQEFWEDGQKKVEEASIMTGD